MKRRIGLAVICATTLLVGCAAARHVRTAPLFADDQYWERVVPKDKSAVLVTEGDLQRKYRPIAKIYVESVGRDKNISFARMRDEAAKMGADAVIQIMVSNQYEGQDINVVTGQNLGPRNRHTLVGLAVVYAKD